MKKPHISLRHRFMLQEADRTLGKIRDTATLLALAGGRFTPMSVLGLLTHALGIAVGFLSKDLDAVAADWHQVTVPRSLGISVTRVTASLMTKCLDTWSYYEIDGQSVLKANNGGAFYAETDAAKVTEFIRDALWRDVGTRAALRPARDWDYEIVKAEPGPAHPSRRADEVWSRIAPLLAAGEVRALLLNGPPRTGKSTIVRRLLALFEQQVGRPLRVLRVAVSDFEWLRPSVVQEVVSFLRPDALVIDDLDRFYASEKLFDLFESVRGVVRLVLVTANDRSKLPLALRMPGRIDEEIEILGVGDEVAEQLAPQAWPRLSEEARATVAGWPLALVTELERRVVILGSEPNEEVADLERRLKTPDKSESPKEKGEKKA